MKHPTQGANDAEKCEQVFFFVHMYFNSKRIQIQKLKASPKSEHFIRFIALTTYKQISHRVVNISIIQILYMQYKKPPLRSLREMLLSICTFHLVTFHPVTIKISNSARNFASTFQLYNEEILDLMDTTLNPEIKVRTKVFALINIQASIAICNQNQSGKYLNEITNIQIA